MNIGYDKPLYILPFDHRDSYEAKMFGWHEPLSESQVADISDSKKIIYEGFLEAVAAGVPQDRAGILVDERFGAALLRDASARGFCTAMPTEKSGQEEYEFEYGDALREHIETFRPTFAKVLVRYNPEGDAEMNRRQTERLMTLSDYLRQSESKFMFELLVPATKTQQEATGKDSTAYDRDLRPSLMVRAVETLQEAGVEPDVWKIEGLDRREDCERFVAAARRDGRDKVGCIVLGRGSDEQKVLEWLKTAATVPGFIGFAVGRTTFWDAIGEWKNGNISREEAASRIARRYEEWTTTFEEAAEGQSEGS